MSALVLFAAGLSTTFLISIGVVRYSVLRCGSRCSNCAAMQIARSSGLYSQTQPCRWSQQFLPCRSTPPRNLCVPPVPCGCRASQAGNRRTGVLHAHLGMDSEPIYPQASVPPTPAPSFKSESWHL